VLRSPPQQQLETPTLTDWHPVQNREMPLRLPGEVHPRPESPRREPVTLQAVDYQLIDYIQEGLIQLREEVTVKMSE
jgi:hypothetical protein